MPERSHAIPELTPSERVWTAITRLDVLAHQLDGSSHGAAETIGVAVPDDNGDMVMYELDYWINSTDGLYWPRIRTEVMADEILGTESITMVSDKKAKLECFTELTDKYSVLSMAERLDMMLKAMRQSRAGAQSWVRPGNNWHS